MTIGEKISRLRKENNYTQEQLAERMGVSRQSVSKWESNIAYPETEKLIQLSQLFGCTTDYLLKEDELEPQSKAKGNDFWQEITGKITHFDKKSKRTFCGLPLWHIGKSAKGIIAIGLKAQGVISIGLLSIGVISIGFLSIGLLALGMLAIGLIAVGCFAVGGLAVGAISLGIISIGAIAIGEFSIGALAVGRYFAYGDYASGMIACGGSNAVGSEFQKVGELTAADKEQIKAVMQDIVPRIYQWITTLVQSIV